MTNILGLATQYWMYIAIGVVLVVMIVLTIIPQRKRQKEQKAMMDSITVGTKIMTIGRMVGKITQVNADNTLIVNVGTENSPTYIVIDRQAVGLVLEAVPVAAPPVAPKAAPVAAPPVAPKAGPVAAPTVAPNKAIPTVVLIEA